MTPYVKVALYDRYACCFYGSNRYDLFSDDASKLFYQFNISLRTAFRLPFNTHRIFMEGLSPSMHLKGQLCSRFVSFTKSLGSCHKLTIRFLFSLALADNRCVARRNLENIADECSLPIGELNCAAVKEKMRYFRAPEHEEWKIALFQNLLSVKFSDNDVQDFYEDEVDFMLNYICTN